MKGELAVSFSTTEDEQWFTALPADLTTTPGADVDDRRSDAERHATRADDGQDTERVVALPPLSTEPAWAGVLADYTPAPVAQSGARPDEGVSGPARQQSWIRRHRSPMSVTGSVGALVALVGGAALLLTGTGDDHEIIAAEQDVPTHAAAAEVSTSEPVASSAAPLSSEQWCARQTGGTRALASSPQPDLAAIARIEDAYYISRDVSAARAQLTAGIDLDPAEFEAAVAAIPVGTDHCVLTSPLAAGQYRVTVIERRPGGEEKRFSSAMTVQRGPDDTAASISGIGQVPG